MDTMESKQTSAVRQYTSFTSSSTSDALTERGSCSSIFPSMNHKHFANRELHALARSRAILPLRKEDQNFWSSRRRLTQGTRVFHNEQVLAKLAPLICLYFDCSRVNRSASSLAKLEDSITQYSVTSNLPRPTSSTTVPPASFRLL